eukprot:TRINITY_DN24098_c0_g1_i1.p1 TRINITY_DN24098_c0_g1~~TRINITY_DN24098_c0_g1_i1.p1  ORF type:complete len:663 (-),score=113.87 TRINITY_DN24098_c0_g1_i1:70-1773(-)
MGKSRFGFEAVQVVNEVLYQYNCRLNKRIFIDFNGGGDRIVKEWDNNPNLSMGVRLLSRGIFDLPFASLQEYLLPEEINLCTTNNVLEEIARIYSKPDSTPVCILIHIDEFQIAHLRCLELGLEKGYVKQMLYTLGDYRFQLFSKQHNLFIIPLLTGTSREGADFAITQYLTHPIYILPLTPDEAIEILFIEFTNPNSGCCPEWLRKLFHSPEFRVLLFDIGVVPRNLERIVKIIKANQSRIQDMDSLTASKVLIYELSKYDFKISELIESLGGTKSLGSKLFLYHVLSGTPVNWSTQFNGKSLQKLAQIGNIFVSPINNSPITSDFHIFFPTFLLNQFAERIGFTIIKQITTFPLLWKEFEVFALAIVMARVDCLLARGKKLSKLKDLFPGAIGNKLLLDITLKLSHLQLSKENKKWIYKPQRKPLIINNNDNIETTDGTGTFSQSLDIFICKPGTKFVDARVCFITKQGEKILLALQMRFTSSNKYLNLNEVYSAIPILQEKYQDYKIVIGVISNQKLTIQKREEIKERNNILVLSEEEISKFVPAISHRLIQLKEISFSLPPTI